MSLNKIRLHFFFFFFCWKLSYNIVVSNQTWKSYHKFFIYSHQTWNASTNSVNKISTQSCVTYDAGFKERATRDVLQKTYSWKFRKIHRKTSVPVSPFQSYRPEVCKCIKKDNLAQVFSCEFCEIFKNTFFTEYLRTTASDFTGKPTDFATETINVKSFCLKLQKILSTPSAVVKKVKLKLVLTICFTVPTIRKNDWPSGTL